nr:MAG TPA: terminase ATPase subunit [Caudoviricetes sp.]
MKKKDVDTEEIARLRNAGMQMEDIVKETGLSKSTIYARLREAGYVCGRKKKPFIPTQKEVQDIVSTYKAGYSSTQLGLRYNVCPNSILKVLKKNGVRIRPSVAVLAQMYRKTRGEREKRRRPGFKTHPPRSTSAGYVVVYAPDHPRAQHGYIWEHVLVVEKELGRYLGPDEVVHHIDRQKNNNDPANLLVLTKSQHCALHYQEKRHMMYRKPKLMQVETEKQALELYEKGLSDGEIAKAIGVQRAVVQRWRSKKGLMSNPYKPKAHTDYQKARGLYEQGHTDVEIAAELSVAPLTILRWRQKEELPRVGRSKVAGLAVRRLYDMGMTDGQIAQRLNVTHQNVAYWRNKHGLRSNYKPPRKLTDEAIEVILTTEEKTKTLAERYGVSQETIRAVRRGERTTKKENGNDEERIA